jgi:hypothetical protein
MVSFLLSAIQYCLFHKLDFFFFNLNSKFNGLESEQSLLFKLKKIDILFCAKSHLITKTANVIDHGLAM